MTRGRTIAVAVVLLLVAGVVGAVRTLRGEAEECGAAVTSLSAARSRTPFLDAAGRREQPDEDRDRAVAALGTGDLGPVVGAVGYHYEQWAQLAAFDQGIGVRTRNNPDFTMLDDQTLRPLWSVQVDTSRSTYDASDGTYLVSTLPRTGPPQLVALDADTGRRQWCHTLSGVRVDEDAAFATQMLDGRGADGVAVLTPGGRKGLRVTLLDGRGRRQWTTTTTAERGDYLGLLDATTLVAGGRSLADLADPREKRPGGVAVQALSVRDGTSVWAHELPAGTAVHVVGVSGGTTVLDQRAGDAPPTLSGLDETGDPAWSVTPGLGPAVDTAVRSGRVLVRGASRWAAYDASTGRLLWRLGLPRTPQLLPYGFALDTVPLLDDDHALIGTTSGLRVLDLTSGRFTGVAALPSDGVSTTFWPYQVAVSRHLVAVATNTSAVLLRRP